MVTEGVAEPVAVVLVEDDDVEWGRRLEVKARS
jgi:hypothetical protein